MAHPKAVPLELNGAKFLVYDFNALCTLRDEGVDAFKLKDEDLEDPRVIRKLVWAGLLSEHPQTSLEQVGSWIDLSNLKEVAEAFTKAFERATQRELPSP